MTKEQIIAGLKNAAKPCEEYYIEDDLIDAINQYPEPFELVEPILEIIATNPLVDFGMPGDLASGRLDGCGHTGGGGGPVLLSVYGAPPEKNQ